MDIAHMVGRSTSRSRHGPALSWMFPSQGLLLFRMAAPISLPLTVRATGTNGEKARLTTSVSLLKCSSSVNQVT